MQLKQIAIEIPLNRLHKISFQLCHYRLIKQIKIDLNRNKLVDFQNLVIII